MPESTLPDTKFRALNIEMLQAGDPEHFQRLYQSYYRIFLTEAIQLLVNKDEAPAIVNHSFIKCWLRSEAITSREYFFAFLRTSINNNCYECNGSREYKSPLQDEVLNSILSGSNFSNKSPKELLYEILSLPGDQTASIREIFGRFYGRGMAVNEIAEETGLEESKVQDSLNMAYKILRVILSEELF